MTSGATRTNAVEESAAACANSTENSTLAFSFAASAAARGLAASAMSGECGVLTDAGPFEMPRKEEKVLVGGVASLYRSFELGRICKVGGALIT